MRPFFVLVFINLFLSVHAQEPILIKDIIPGPKGGTENAVTFGFVLDSLYFFQAQDETNGFELWKTDGTAGGTVLLKNINPLGYDSLISFTNIQEYLIEYKNIIYFYAVDEINYGGSIWRTDGTIGGTYKFFEECSSGCQHRTSFGIVNDKLVFTGTGVDGDELWATDGTFNNTVLLKEINAGPGGSQPLDFHLFNGYIYFTATNSGSNRELWRTDATPTGTTLFVDLDGVDTTGSNPKILGVTGNYMYFSAIGSAATGRELWKTDGSIQGTTIVKDINPGSSNGIEGTSIGKIAAVMGDKLLFLGNDGVNGREWWITNGPSGSTQMLKDIIPGSGNLGGGRVLFASDSFVLLTLNDMIHGTELWKTDGTTGGTYLFKDFWTGSGGGANGSADYYKLTVHNNKVYFVAQDEVYGTEIWVSDGTDAGTMRLTDMNYHLSNFKDGLQVINDYLYFTAPTDEYGYEVWKLLIDAPSNTQESTDGVEISFAVYPNPSHGQLLISGNASVPSDVQVALFDMQGKLIVSQKFNQLSGAFVREVNVAEAPAGLYLLSLQTETGIQTKLISIVHH